MTEYHFNAEDFNCVLSNEIKSQHTLYHARRSCFCLLECGGEKEALPDIWEGGGGG